MTGYSIDRCYKNLQKIGESPKNWRSNWRSPIFWRSYLEIEIGDTIQGGANFLATVNPYKIIGIKGFVAIVIYKPQDQLQLVEQ